MNAVATGSVIEVRGLVNRFGAQLVHDRLDMDVQPGEIFGIVGGSGSGKSVLLRSILGLQRPQAGTVRLHGRDITQISEVDLKTVKADYGVTFQAGALYSSLTVLQNVQLPMVEHYRFSEHALAELAMLKIRMVGLPIDAGAKFPAQLSGGMIKRAALARALALDPRLLFLDEPTSGLDPIGAAEFDDLIQTLQRTLGLTVFMVTHDLDSLYAICDRIAALADGKVIAAGPMATMLASDHPWLRSYFHGKRARAIEPQAVAAQVGA